MSFTLIAHRGFSSDAPENTFAAFDLAIQAGFLHLEFDVPLTADGLPVVVHDDTVGRTTNGNGAVASLTLTQLQALDAGAQFQAPANTHFGPQPIPTLEALFARYGGKVHFHLELKSHEHQLAATVAELVQRQSWSASAGAAMPAVPALTITSFDLAQVARSRRLLPHLQHGWLVHEIDAGDLAIARDLRLSQFDLLAGSISADVVRAVREARFDIRAWGVRSLEDLDRVVDSGASGCTVDWPGKARDHLTTR